MTIDTTCLKNAIFLQTHNKLSDFLLRIQKIESVLCNEEVRPMFLSTLVNSDDILDIDSANESLDKLKFIKDNMNFMNLDENVNKIVSKYIKDTSKNVRKLLKEIKKKED